MVGPDSGRAAHVGGAIFGVVITEREDGTAGRYSAGDAYAVSSGHDAWVLGDESVVTFEFDGTSGA